MSRIRARDQSRSVVSSLLSETIIDPTIQAPAGRSGERPPATPKLMRPQQSPAIADARDPASVLPSPLQMACVYRSAAIRASTASPVTPITAAKSPLPNVTVASALDELLVALRGPARRKVMRSAHMK